MSNWLTEGLSARTLKREEVKALKSSEKFLKKVELNKQKCYNIFNNSRVANCPKCGSTNLGILSYDEKKLFSTNYAIFCKNEVEGFINALKSLEKDKKRVQRMKETSKSMSSVLTIDNVDKWFSSFNR